MEYIKYNPGDIIFSLDIGTRSIIGTVGVVREKKFIVLHESYLEHEERAMIDGQIHDISLVADGVDKIKRNLEQALGLPLTNVAIAAAGRFLRTATVNIDIDIQNDREIDKDTVRGLEMAAVRKAEEEFNSHSNGRLYCVGYSVKNYFLNGYVITNLLSHRGDRAGVEVIATFLPRSVVDSLYAVMNKVGLNVTSLTLEPIAAIEAAIPQNLRLLNLALVDIGAGTSDIAISSKESISAYGMVPVAGDEVTEAIAQAYLVDFNTAERMKKESGSSKVVSYMDILGFENQVDSEEIYKVISPVVEKIAIEVSGRIIELNGGKSPNAVFLVGGGAHTPGLKEMLGAKLNLPIQRIGIKGREAVTDCLCSDNNLGSIGVTVLGIALVSIKRAGHDFINVTLNGSVVSLFNSHRHTVMDAMVQAGINPKALIGRNGKNIRFTVNSVKRLAFGSLAEGPVIRVNGEIGTIDSDIKEGDNIEINFARDGIDARPKVYEYIQNIETVSFYFNDIIYNLEPVAFINGVTAGLEVNIKENDELVIVKPSSLGDFIRLCLNEREGQWKYYLKDKEIDIDYNIKEGDRIYCIRRDVKEIPSEVISNSQDTYKDIDVFVNGQKVILKGKHKYIFVDVFNFFEFDLSSLKGKLVLKLNKITAGYHDELKTGDVIEIYWE